MKAITLKNHIYAVEVEEASLNSAYKESIILQSIGEHEKAFEKLYFLAQHNFPVAQFDIGWMYFNGRGVQQNKSLAFQWWAKAKTNGFKDAEILLEDKKSLR